MQTYVLEDFLTKAECEELIRAYDSPAAGKVNQNIHKPSVRKNKVVLLERPDLQALLLETLASVNERFYGFDISSVEQLQLARYDEGDYYAQHLDLGPGPASVRKISASVQLSLPDTYGGGNLDVMGVDKSELVKRGTLIAFPSYVPHTIEMVTRGTRYALVGWATGSRAFR